MADPRNDEFFIAGTAEQVADRIEEIVEAAGSAETPHKHKLP